MGAGKQQTVQVVEAAAESSRDDDGGGFFHFGKSQLGVGEVFGGGKFLYGDAECFSPFPGVGGGAVAVT